jgi:hypothetical protein
MKIRPTETDHASRRANLLRRLGVIGFGFFLIKGLLWLVVPLVLLFWNFLGF